MADRRQSAPTRRMGYQNRINRILHVVMESQPPAHR